MITMVPPLVATLQPSNQGPGKTLPYPAFGAEAKGRVLRPNEEASRVDGITPPKWGRGTVTLAVLRLQGRTFYLTPIALLPRKPY